MQRKLESKTLTDALSALNKGACQPHMSYNKALPFAVLLMQA